LRGLDAQNPLLFAAAGERVDAGGEVREQASLGEDVHRRCGWCGP
jgi:hypothetical protein